VIGTFTQGIRDGRNGRGVIYIWPAGDSNEKHFNTGFDAYANTMATITVGAVDSAGMSPNDI
tara:strand:- start:47 stop:232 length:186 start_codon:yes stop_codon:yes gene_type:complete